MVDRPTAYLVFWETIQTITDVFDYVQKRTTQWDEIIDNMALTLEELADETIEIAANQDWPTGIQQSGIRDHWRDCQRLFENELAEYFRSY